jgi:hypothetical protein
MRTATTNKTLKSRALGDVFREESRASKQNTSASWYTAQEAP